MNSPEIPASSSSRPANEGGEPHPGLDADHAGDQSGVFADAPPPATGEPPAKEGETAAASAVVGLILELEEVRGALAAAKAELAEAKLAERGHLLQIYNQAKAIAAADEGKKDSRRLEFLEESMTRLVDLDTEPEQPQRIRLEFWQGVHGHKAVEAETVRAVVDLAMSPSPAAGTDKEKNL